MARVRRKIAWAVASLLIVWARAVFVFPRGVCRFQPTCSEYARDAWLHLSIPMAAVKVVWRLLRCNPLCRGGYDPVSEAKGRCGE